MARQGRTTPLWLLLVLLTLTGCTDAFRSGSSGATVVLNIELEFSDGTTQKTLPQGGTVSITLWVPRTGYQQLLAPGNGTVDPARMRVHASPGLGSFGPNDDLALVLDGFGFIQAGAANAGRVPIAIDFPLTGPLTAPAGLLTLTVTVVDDVDRDSDPLEVQATIVSLDLPTVVLTVERPPDSGTQITGLPLPTNQVGDAFIGEMLPFVLVVRGIPNATSGTGFDNLLAGGGIDPARFVVTADRDLGDPNNNGIAAGQNLADQFGLTLDIDVDPVTGEFTAPLAVWLADPRSPALGRIIFEGQITDDLGAVSDPQNVALQVDPAVSLVNEVLPLNQNFCGVSGCHNFYYPVRNLQLDTKDAILATAVLVDAVDTDENTSCAAMRIQPYDTDASYYMHKMWGSHRDPCVGGRGQIMPPTPSKPTQAEIDLIGLWIQQGAYDN